MFSCATRPWAARTRLSLLINSQNKALRARLRPQNSFATPLLITAQGNVVTRPGFELRAPAKLASTVYYSTIEPLKQYVKYGVLRICKSENIREPIKPFRKERQAARIK